MHIKSSTFYISSRNMAVILIASLSVFAGCHRLTPEQQMTAFTESGYKNIPTFMTSEEIKQMENRRYMRIVRNTLSRAIFRANHNNMQDSVKLRMKLDRRGDVLLCEAKPPHAKQSSSFANLVQDTCWSLIWSPVPEGLQSPADGSLDLVIPIFSEETQHSPSDYEANRQRKAAEESFLWSNLLAKHSINAFGRAQFLLTGNERGEVVRCDVELVKHSYRPDEFRPDPALQQQLTEQCSQLDLRQMPHFKVGPNGTGTRVVWVNYMPWRRHVGKY